MTVTGLVQSTDYYLRLDVVDFAKKAAMHLFYLMLLVVRITVMTVCSDTSPLRPG
jgi:hypothetical protein